MAEPVEHDVGRPFLSFRSLPVAGGLPVGVEARLGGQIFHLALHNGLHVLQAGLVGEDALQVAGGDVALAEGQTLLGDALGPAASGVVAVVRRAVGPGGQLRDAFDTQPAAQLQEEGNEVRLGRNGRR